MNKIVAFPCRGVCCVTALVAAFGAMAQDFPVRPIRFVLGPAPDMLPRLVGQKLTEQWRQQVIIDPRPAANGLIAAETVAKANPDGHTWLLTTGAFVTDNILQVNTRYLLLRDFAPVALLATLPFVLVVNPSVPASSVAELIKVARARPGQLNYASVGDGSTSHLAGELLKSIAGIDVTHVPYKSVMAGILDTVGGQVQLMFGAAQVALPLARAGRLRALAVSTAKRSPGAPDIPTLAEAGVPGYEINPWNGVHVPALTPRPIVERLNRDIVRVLKEPEMIERMIQVGLDPSIMSVAEFDAFVKSIFTRYTKIIKDLGIRTQ